MFHLASHFCAPGRRPFSCTVPALRCGRRASSGRARFGDSTRGRGRVRLRRFAVPVPILCGMVTSILERGVDSIWHTGCVKEMVSWTTMRVAVGRDGGKHKEIVEVPHLSLVFFVWATGTSGRRKPFHRSSVIPSSSPYTSEAPVSYEVVIGISSGHISSCAAVFLLLIRLLPLPLQPRKFSNWTALCFKYVHFFYCNKITNS
mmetsp:Transcript_29004/g.57725  ORF Transcript_29004/g.57725 Transcript_29004/m.57725 type:complete len:203 (-) Transcript_29004:34-642(-)